MCSVSAVGAAVTVYCTERLGLILLVSWLTASSLVSFQRFGSAYCLRLQGANILCSLVDDSTRPHGVETQTTIMLIVSTVPSALLRALDECLRQFEARGLTR